jgi:hypothetical protein
VSNKYFPHAKFKAAISAWFTENGDRNRACATAWEKLCGTTIVVAQVDYGMRKASTAKERDEALACAWEDTFIAFKGYGDNVVTGSLLQIWHYVKPEDRESLREAIETACTDVTAYYKKNGVRWRYLARYRNASVKSLPEDFTLPTALPTSGRALADWAGDEGYDPEVIEEVMHASEVQEQSKAVRAALSAPKVSANPRGQIIQFRPLGG